MATTIGVSMLKTSVALVKTIEGASTEGMGSIANVSSALVAAGGDLRDKLCSDNVFSLHMTSWKENIHSCGNSSTATEAGEQDANSQGSILKAGSAHNQC
jgi:hypothetical protein